MLRMILLNTRTRWEGSSGETSLRGEEALAAVLASTAGLKRYCG